MNKNQIAKLKTLIDSEPLNAARTNEEVKDWCNDKSIPSQYNEFEGFKILRLTDDTEFLALTNGDRRDWLLLCSYTEVNVKPNKTPMKFGEDIFPASSVTLADIEAARDYLARPRDTENLPKVKLGNVIEARAL